MLSVHVEIEDEPIPLVLRCALVMAVKTASKRALVATAFWFNIYPSTSQVRLKLMHASVHVTPLPPTYQPAASGDDGGGDVGGDGGGDAAGGGGGDGGGGDAANSAGSVAKVSDPEGPETLSTVPSNVMLTLTGNESFGERLDVSH